jgi:hypothetical protein
MDQVKQLSLQVAALELHVADLRTALFLLLAGRDVAPLCRPSSSFRHHPAMLQYESKFLRS